MTKLYVACVAFVGPLKFVRRVLEMIETFFITKKKKKMGEKIAVQGRQRLMDVHTYILLIRFYF